MKARLIKEFSFEASHRLEYLTPDHPCFNLHGHSYKVEIEVAGEIDLQTGFVIDFAKLNRVMAPLLAQLDHHHLNDIPGIKQTSSECLALWIWEQIKPRLPILTRVSIRESDFTRCDYTGD